MAPAPPRPSAQRAARMTAGVEELATWLADQVRAGLAGLDGGSPAFDRLAARLVDAQLPGAAAWLRRLAAVPTSGEGWPGRLLEELALLHLLVNAYRRLPDLDHATAATVLAHLGVTTPTRAVLAGPAVRDRWSVLALRDTLEDRLVARRVWLLGRGTGRVALVLTFTPVGRSPDATLTPGRTLDADLHYYPAAAPLRAVLYPDIRRDHGPVVGFEPQNPPPGHDHGGVRGVGLGEAVAQFSRVVALDPWLRAWPVVVGGVVVVRDGAGWAVTDGDLSLPLRPSADDDPSALFATTGGRPSTLLVEMLPDAVRPLAVVDAEDDADEDVDEPTPAEANR